MYTYETVTVNDAISRGRKMISYPVTAIIFATIALGCFLAVQALVTGWVIVAIIAAGFVAAWVYWSFMITKWRIWAFDNVRNVHELQRKAVEAQLIWNEGSFWEKTEIRSAADKAKLESLQSKFDQKDVFTDDVTLPAETLIYYSKKTIYFEIGIMTIFLGAGIYLLVTGIYLPGVFSCGIGLFFIYSEYKKVANKDPQIIINEKGMETSATGFHEWKDISDDEVITRPSGRSSVTNLEYNYPGGSAKLNISELDTNKKALEDILHTYRLRSERSNALAQQMV